MSIEWQDSVRNHDGKQGASSAGAMPPAALSQNPRALSGPPTQCARPGAEPAYTPAGRPDYPLLILKIVNIVAWTAVGIVLLNLYKLGII